MFKLSWFIERVVVDWWEWWIYVINQNIRNYDIATSTISSSTTITCILFLHHHHHQRHHHDHHHLHHHHHHHDHSNARLSRFIGPVGCSNGCLSPIGSSGRMSSVLECMRSSLRSTVDGRFFVCQKWCMRSFDDRRSNLGNKLTRSQFFRICVDIRVITEIKWQLKLSKVRILITYLLVLYTLG